MRSIRSAAVAGAALLLLAGCSHGSPPAGAAGQAAPATGASSAGFADNPDTSSGVSSARCLLVTKADAQAFMTDPVSTVQVNAAGGNSDGQECIFDSTGGGSVDITVGPDSDPLMSYAAQLGEIGKPVSVPGVGDKAVRDGSQESGAILSIKAGTVCSVGATDENIPGVGALDEAAGATNNIGDANYAIIAAALGTLCNRIYGSGKTTPDLTGLKVIVTSGGDALPTNFSMPTDSLAPTS